MDFPRFWAKGRSGNFTSWHWSSNSLAEAQSLADAAARRNEENFNKNDRLNSHGGYYPNRPMREQVLQELHDDSGKVAAVVTRNSYGCTVLNTARVMFVDIDHPEPKTGGFLSRLFGKPAPATPHDSTLALIENWSRQNPDWGWRIYRTRAGMRLLATQGSVEADSEIAKEVFASLGADPLYQTLCLAQKCFRARLSPKPWRCGIRTKPDRWPLLDAKAEKRFQKWEAQYQSFAFNWATCEFVRAVGNPAIHPEVETIIKLHDSATKAESKLQLA